MLEEPVGLCIMKRSTGSLSGIECDANTLMTLTTERFRRMAVGANGLHGEGLRTMSDEEIGRVISGPGFRRQCPCCRICVKELFRIQRVARRPGRTC